MMLGKVVGSIVATRKDERLVGQKLLLVEPLIRRGDGTLDGDRDRMLVSVDVVKRLILHKIGTTKNLFSGRKGCASIPTRLR